MKEYIVIGAGKFGSSVATTIANMKKTVLVVDKDKTRIQGLSDVVTHSIIADATNEKTMKSLELGNFDVAIVSIGSDIKSAILVTLLAKEQGVKYIICKANDELQAKVLYKIGADKVVFPERDMGTRLAHNLLSTNVLDSLEIDPEYSVMEILVKEEWIDKTLLEIDFRKKYKANVLAIKRDRKLDVQVDANEKLNKEDILIVLGNKQFLNKFFESC